MSLENEQHQKAKIQCEPGRITTEAGKAFVSACLESEDIWVEQRAGRVMIAGVGVDHFNDLAGENQIPFGD